MVGLQQASGSSQLPARAGQHGRGFEAEPSEERPGLHRLRHRRDDGDRHHHSRSFLPHGARRLCCGDYAALRPIFAHYLTLQKGLRLADLSESEARRRWKSFVGRWNCHGLSDGWYQQQMSLRAVRAQAEQARCRHRQEMEEKDDDDGGGADEDNDGDHVVEIEGGNKDDTSSPAINDEGLARPNDSSLDSGLNSDHDAHRLFFCALAPSDGSGDGAGTGPQAQCRPRPPWPQDLLCHDERAEHCARLEELLPRTESSRGAAGPSTADASNYRRTLEALLLQQQLQQRRREAGLVAGREVGGPR